MYAAEVTAASKAAAGKRAMLSKNPIGYFVLSMLAGAYIGFGNILINVIGGQLAGSPATKTVMGVSFGIALSLVVIAGSELFTGNTMVMSLGIMKKAVTLADAAKLIMVFWCLFAFITCGSEHSVANMTRLTVALLDPSARRCLYFYNLITVTLGNMVGSICFVAVPYFLGQKMD